MQSVVVRSLTKTWGEATAVDDVSFAVTPGQLLVLLGPSGCGKSTTLRLIAGLDEPTAGTIEIGGKDVRGLTGAARGVANGIPVLCVASSSVGSRQHNFRFVGAANTADGDRAPA